MAANKPDDEKRDAWLHVRLRPDEKQRLDEAVRRSGQTASEIIRGQLAELHESSTQTNPSKR